MAVATAPSESSLLTSAVTWRAIGVGALCCLALGLGGPYATHVLRGSYMDLDFSTPGAVFLLFFLVVGPNALLRWLYPRKVLSPAELLTTYSMMIVASAIPTMGLSAQLYPIISAPFYYASPENKWADLICRYIPSWVAPQGSAVGSPVIKYFYEGLPPGSPIPWGAWIVPVVTWLILLFALHLAMICSMVLLRRQWADHERLVYPLTQLPVELAGVQSGGRPVLLRSPWMWIGFALPFFFGSLTGLHNYFPSIPTTPMAWNIPVFRHSLDMSVRISFPMIGFFYLVNLESSLSLWFFNRLFFIARGIMNIYHIGLQESLGIYGAQTPTFAHLGMGALFALFASNMWAARRFLGEAWGRVKGRNLYLDEGETVSYRFAFWGLVLGLAVMGIWLNLAGMPAIVVVFFLTVAMLIFIGLTRVVVESGLAEAVAPSIAPGITTSSLGTSIIGNRGIIALGMTYVWCSDLRTLVMTSAAHALKMADLIQHDRRRLFAAMWIAIAVAVISSGWITVRDGYAIGGTTMNGWFFNGGPLACYKWVQEKLLAPTRPNWPGWGLTAAGMTFYLLLTAARFRYASWPLHPLGLVVGGTWLMDQLWCTCLIAWLLKTVTLRYGGPKTLQKMRPLFLGLILGQFTCNAVWLFLDWATHHTNNGIFWI
jgi:hypothetical protein